MSWAKAEVRTTAPRDILILGCGFTGKRVAARLLEQGHRVICSVRHVETLPCLASAGARVEEVDTERPATLRNLEQVVPPEVLVLHSVPLVKTATEWEDPTPVLLGALRGSAARIVYLSTTGV
jgi:nucleoside-diphosphate-sugar epimerase